MVHRYALLSPDDIKADVERLAVRNFSGTTGTEIALHQVVKKASTL